MAIRFGSLMARCGIQWPANYLSRNLSSAPKSLTSAPKSLTSNSIDDDEVAKFNTSADTWWKPNLLHTMNTVRVPIIRDGILSVHGITTKKPLPLEGFRLLDVGCGGGILCEPLARLGAKVTGLDPGEENIKIATLHSSIDAEIKDRINYVCDTVENLVVTSTEKYDAIVCSEVIEHVANPQSFVNSCYELVKDGGSMFFTTMSRTTMSYITTILLAEYILNIVSPGLHDWNKYVTPKELSDMLKQLNCRVVSIQGYIYNPATQKFVYTENSDVMYALHAVK
ncbi:hypothetical protein JTE90_019760 [Oedothorax gibbosus]|uniref:Ubiquinone biosynthesis O-methyltransferase, mitochondrial n=1 Tax=Oedothorax gibbosus TaxID=931172 RepID=A0AAV6UM32_9ARAC|nr:hypothetical protein JTE90_019760 [Oedothorax gibbosus]